MYMQSSWLKSEALQKEITPDLKDASTEIGLTESFMEKSNIYKHGLVVLVKD